MRHFFIFIFLIGLVTTSYSQFESNTTFKGIPPANTNPKSNKKEPLPPKDSAVTIPPKIHKNTNAVQLVTPVVPQMEKSNEISMIPKPNNFINPGDEVRDKLNNRKADRQEGIEYRRNQNFGTYHLKSPTARVMYRDAQYVDGDLIRVYLNDKIIESYVYLESNYKGFEIALEKGFNKIEFEALNQGDSGPNTAQFQVFDDKNNLVSASEWNLGTGFKATIIIVKE